ncbi:NAD-dependent epimerase/dehydratase family protein [Geoalkalibacter sp.]|uniref:NAD-dependent epimerase/dehydratase family protein n=1 Tax=Geoalkalibacter sp. TaxID=3041440 RepID=UPI00272E8920|nr:NAD-dependent epimerase/dehydratase family protein [Geoalkalibacter sp.]
MILVTGGTGYLGRALVARLLEQGEPVRILSRQPRRLAAEVCVGDLNDQDRLREALRGVRVVYHLAALVDHYASPEELHRVNVQGTQNLAAAAIRQGVSRFVHCSSVSAEPGGGSTVYGRSKIAAEQALEGYQSRLAILRMRPGPVYDEERKNLQRLIGFARRAHLCPRLLPDVRIHLASRKNVTDAFLLAKTAGIPGNAYAICDRQPVQRSTLARIIQRHTSARDLPLPLAPLYPALYAMALGCEGLQALLGRRPLIDRHYLRVLTRARQYDLGPAQRELGYVPAPTEAHFGETVHRILELQRSKR